MNSSGSSASFPPAVGNVAARRVRNWRNRRTRFLRVDRDHPRRAGWRTISSGSLTPLGRSTVSTLTRDHAAFVRSSFDRRDVGEFTSRETGEAEDDRRRQVVCFARWCCNSALTLVARRWRVPMIGSGPDSGRNRDQNGVTFRAHMPRDGCHGSRADQPVSPASVIVVSMTSAERLGSLNAPQRKAATCSEPIPGEKVFVRVHC